VVDLHRAEVRAELDISLESLTGARSRAHRLARRARALGAEGMVVPSAAHDGAWNLVVFPAGFSRLRVAGSRAMNPRQPVGRFTG
jgi:RES domain-containing protein